MKGFKGRADIEDAMSCGADVSIQSTHKTLTSLSQTAMLHISDGAYRNTRNTSSSLASDVVIRMHDSVFSALTTTSPNSLLLASLDLARSKATLQQSTIMRTGQMVDNLREELRVEASEAVTLLDDSIVVREMTLKGLVLLDPLRLSVKFNKFADSTVVDDDLCESMGIFCELNEKNCITYAVPPYSSEYPESFSTLSRALKSIATIAASDTSSVVAEDDDLNDEWIRCSSLVIVDQLSYVDTQIKFFQEILPVDSRLCNR